MTESDDIRGLQLSLGMYALVLAMKLVVYWMTGVTALFAEALHTLSDIFISGFLLLAAIWSRKEADELHMFGYGRAQNVAAVVAATLFISFTSFELYREAIPRLFRPEDVTYKNLPAALGVIVVSMLIAAVPLFRSLRRKERGAAARAHLTELINDELGLLAALIGTLFVVWGKPLADPLAAIAVATIIAYNAIGLFRENSSVLLGRSPGPQFLSKVERLASSVPGVVGVHDLRAEFIGPERVHAGMHVEVERGLPIEEADRIAEEVRGRVHQDMRQGYCFVHVDPAEPREA
ncbi:MAG: cation diffusion facilitator family transporter [Anaerolineae bacterium]